MIVQNHIGCGGVAFTQNPCLVLIHNIVRFYFPTLKTNVVTVECRPINMYSTVRDMIHVNIEVMLKQFHNQVHSHC